MKPTLEQTNAWARESGLFEGSDEVVHAAMTLAYEAGRKDGRKWQRLTDNEILEEYRQSYGDDGNLTDVYFAHAIEAKLKEKNG